MGQERICGVWAPVSCESIPHLVSVKNPPQGAPEAPARRTESLTMILPGFCAVSYLRPRLLRPRRGRGKVELCSYEAQGGATASWLEHSLEHRCYLDFGADAPPATVRSPEQQEPNATGLDAGAECRHRPPPKAANPAAAVHQRRSDAGKHRSGDGLVYP